VLDYYGLTESYPLCANYPFMKVREGSMGRPMPGWDVQILDGDENPVTQGERGEICLRARSNPHYPLGYWNDPEASEEGSAASGSTPRTRPSRTRTATTGTPDPPTR
jgi:acetyl-CoA synthetase